MGFLCCASRSNPAYSSDATPSTAPQTVRPTPTVTPARDQSLHLSKKEAGSAKAPSVKKVPSAKKLPTVPPPTPSATSGSTIQHQPYIATRATDLFSSYADPDDPTVIGPEGFERLCSDVGLQMDGAQPLVLAWMLEAAEMGKITKDEWSKATSSLQYVLGPSVWHPRLLSRLASPVGSAHFLSWLWQSKILSISCSCTRSHPSAPRVAQNHTTARNTGAMLSHQRQGRRHF
jgi:hypothetical protein